MSEETKVQETQVAADQPAAEQEPVQETVQEASEGAASTDDLSNVTVLKKGDIVTGTIVKVEDAQAFVDIAYKYDGIIPIRELTSLHVDNANDIVEIGQKVECKIVSINDNKEQLILSKKSIDSEKGWEEIQKHFDNQDTFEVKVADVVKGGLVVDLGVRGFIPASMVERHFVEDFSDYKGRVLQVKVKEIDRENNKVILSRKEVLEEEYEAKKKAIMESLSVGQQLDGTIQRLTPFGAFVDIGGIDGLVHISELSWTHVEQPSDVVKEGDKVTVKILKLDPQNDKISLSLKATQPGPWDVAADSIRPGEIVSGVVKRLVSFGAFVEIAAGVEGLVHISQISHRHIGTPHEVLKEGQTVQVKILDFNPAEKRVSLSIKETEEAPAQAPKPEKQPKREKIDLNNDNVSLSNQSMSMTLGERFGDKLSKFK